VKLNSLELLKYYHPLAYSRIFYPLKRLKVQFLLCMVASADISKEEDFFLGNFFGNAIVRVKLLTSGGKEA